MNITKRSNNPTASTLLNRPSMIRRYTTISDIKRNATLYLRSSLVIGTSFIIAPMAKTRPILQIQEPMALPAARPVSPIALDIDETINSGVVVTILTIVAPIKTFDKRRERDISTADRK